MKKKKIRYHFFFFLIQKWAQYVRYFIGTGRSKRHPSSIYYWDANFTSFCQYPCITSTFLIFLKHTFFFRSPCSNQAGAMCRHTLSSRPNSSSNWGSSNTRSLSIRWNRPSSSRESTGNISRIRYNAQERNIFFKKERIYYWNFNIYNLLKEDYGPVCK